jgi:hypothetical protein
MGMRLDPDTIAQALLTAPGWARVGLSAPTQYLREAAAKDLAMVILDFAAAGEEGLAPADQLRLAL